MRKSAKNEYLGNFFVIIFANKTLKQVACICWKTTLGAHNLEFKNQYLLCFFCWISCTKTCCIAEVANLFRDKIYFYIFQYLKIYFKCNTYFNSIYFMKVHSFLTLVRHLALGGCSNFLVVKALAGGCTSQASQKMLICHN